MAKVQQATREAERLPGVVPAGVLSIASPRLAHLTIDGDRVDVRPFMETVPRRPAELDQLRRDLLGSPLYRELVVSADGSTAAVLVDLSDAAPNAAIRHALEAIATRLRDDQTEVYIGGVPIMNAYLEEYSRRVGFVFPFTLLVVALVHYEAFRTLQAVGLPLVTALISLLLSLGIIGWLGYPLDPWNAITPVIVLAIAAGHAVQMLKRYYEELAHTGDNRQAIIDSLAKVGPVMLTAGGVAAAGFASLATFNVPSVRVFGVLMAGGVAAALVVELTLIPAVRALLPPRRRELHREASGSLVTRAVDDLSRTVVRSPRAVLLGAVALVALAAGGITRLRVNNSYRDWFYPGSQARREDDFISQRFGGSVRLHLLLEGTAPQSLEDPRVVQAVADLTDQLNDIPQIGKVVSYVDFLRELHRALHANERAGEELPATRELIAQYLLMYSMALGPRELGWMLDPAHSAALIVASSRSDEADFGRALIDRVRQFGETRFAGLPARLRVAAGSLGLQVAMNEEILREKLSNMLQVSIVIFVLSSVALRSLHGGLLVLAPLAFAVLVNLGLMGWSGTWLSMVTATITSLGISVGADFSIYLLYRIKEERADAASLVDAVARALRTAGHAVFFVSSAILAGYLTLTAAGFRTWVQVGGLSAAMIATSALATLTVVPALVLRLRPRFIERAVIAPHVHAASESAGQATAAAAIFDDALVDDGGRPPDRADPKVT